AQHLEAHGADAARILSLAGGEDLVGFQFPEQGGDGGGVGRAGAELAVASVFVEGQVEEAFGGGGHAGQAQRGAGLAAAQQSLEASGFGRVGGLRVALLGGERGADFSGGRGGVGGAVDKIEHEVGGDGGLLVGHGEVARGQVNDGDVVALFDEAREGAAHAEHLVGGFGGEDDHAFGVGRGALGAVGVVGVGFAAGPAGDGVLDLVEDADVEVVGGALLGEQVGHAVFAVVFVEEFEHGAFDLAGEPGDGAAGEGGGPF